MANFYRTNFQLNQEFDYSLTELDEMVPWEREIYVTLIMQKLEEEKLKAMQNG